MRDRQEIEKREAAVRNSDDGWVSEFIFAVPMVLITAVVWIASLMGMHYIEWGTLF
ncbi:hypothetical protein [Corynebacterium phocae]|uniref:hypothetical protein n=1 Tax=Corynebacterium phocae TaxID=161895 RepID=UPI0012EEBD29|nr:hypothetical protein [Corynebacterium phocae]